MEGTRPLTGPALTNDLCGQYFKIKVKTTCNLRRRNRESARLRDGEFAGCFCGLTMLSHVAHISAFLLDNRVYLTINR